MASHLPVVLVPGMLCSPELFAPQLAYFEGEREVLIADNKSADTMAGLAANALAAAPERFALCGLSMGGYIAFEIMRQAPERVARLALLDTRASADSPEELEGRRALAGVARASGLRPVVKTLLPRLVHLSRLQDAALTQIVHRMAEDIGLDGFMRQMSAVMNRPDSRPDLTDIRCPTVVVVGDGDALTPRHFAEEMAFAIAGARLEVVPQCGHLSTLERPDRINAILNRWLDGD